MIESNKEIRIAILWLVLLSLFPWPSFALTCQTLGGTAGVSLRQFSFSVNETIDRENKVFVLAGLLQHHLDASKKNQLRGMNQRFYQPSEQNFALARQLLKLPRALREAVYLQLLGNQSQRSTLARLGVLFERLFYYAGHLSFPSEADIGSGLPFRNLALDLELIIEKNQAQSSMAADFYFNYLLLHDIPLNSQLEVTFLAHGAVYSERLIFKGLANDVEKRIFNTVFRFATDSAGKSDVDALLIDPSNIIEIKLLK